MTIALRFIPTLIEETDKIMSAQKARGADLESGGLIQRAKALIPILIPLFVSAFRRADELALASQGIGASVKKASTKWFACTPASVREQPLTGQRRLNTVSIASMFTARHLSCSASRQLSVSICLRLRF
mgnify:CR=1 FL=1